MFTPCFILQSAVLIHHASECFIKNHIRISITLAIRSSSSSRSSPSDRCFSSSIRPFTRPNDHPRPYNETTARRFPRKAKGHREHPLYNLNLFPPVASVFAVLYSIIGDTQVRSMKDSTHEDCKQRIKHDTKKARTARFSGYVRPLPY